MGRDGNDVLIGGLGSDTIDGGTGDDTMTGGLNADTFVFDVGSGADTITDFKVNQDLIDLSALFADFSEVEGLLSQNGPNTEIAFNAGNGDVLTLNHVGLGALDADDFVF
jgi:Ca2+-binding RTX toxin-like protein